MKQFVISIIELQDRIDVLRNYMIDTAELNGLSHPNTIKCSQELDILLNQYQKLNQKDKLKVVSLT